MMKQLMRVRHEIYECTNTDVLSCFKMTKLY